MAYLLDKRELKLKKEGRFSFSVFVSKINSTPTQSWPSNKWELLEDLERNETDESW